MDNQKIAEIFEEIADILEIEGANRFRVLAYRKAAQNIVDLGVELNDLYQQDPKKLNEIWGIGKDLAAKITELLTSGKCLYHQELIERFDRGLLELLKVRSLGPKKVKLFYTNLKINSIASLRQAAETGKLRELPGMGEKSEKEILKALQEYDQHKERMMLSEALKLAAELLKHLKTSPEVVKAEYAGSLRRMRETIGDIDILVCGHDSAKIIEHFLKYRKISNILANGDTKVSVMLRMGMQCDLRIIDEKIFGAALHYFTGSKEHNIAIRDRAKKMGLKINEYGVFKIDEQTKFETLIGGKTETEIFKAVGLPYIIPEMREDRGEIPAALNGTLPIPLELQDLKGDFHVHSKWSDGTNEIEEMARAYRAAGFEYIALTDHSPSLAVAHGLTPERFAMQWDEIDQLNREFQEEHEKGAPPFKILKGVECDIKLDGSMDLPDDVLAKMDIVIASVHSHFNLSGREQTERVIKAFQNPHVKIFGHPSGRLINRRKAYDLDYEKMIQAAIDHQVALEINSQPQRLDLFDYYCKVAKEKGAKFTIDADSHHTSEISHLQFGIAIAKRGWLEKKDVLNTLTLKELVTFFNITLS